MSGAVRVQRWDDCRILVCGGRHFNDHDLMREALREFQPLYDTTGNDPAVRRPERFILGGATGADAMAASWCMAYGVPFKVYKADWQTHGRAAGPIRNARMLAEGKPDLVVAFPGGRGTADMVRQARAAGVEVREIKPRQPSPEAAP